MKTVLAAETLASGETLTIECVSAPDAEREAQIIPFLVHKPPNYREHIESAFADKCDALETRFYIGLIDNEIVGNIMTVESGGVGIFGHVFTRPDQRRKGICDAIMRHQMEDFRRRDGHVLLLGTGYQSAAYYIYAKHGFRDWTVGHPGLMRYDAEPEGVFESRFFDSSSVTPVAAGWKHWPLLALLATTTPTAHLRSLTLNLWGVGLLEGPYCQYFHRYGHRPEARAGALEAETGAALALATCVPDERWPGMHLLDVFAHSSLRGREIALLLASLNLPAGRIQAATDPNDTEKIVALEHSGFVRSAVLHGQYQAEETWHDVWLYTR